MYYEFTWGKKKKKKKGGCSAHISMDRMQLIPLILE